LEGLFKVKLASCGRFRAIAIAAVFSACAVSRADINVFLNFNNFANTAQTAWSNAGFGGANALTPAEIAQLQTNIKTIMEGHYAGYTVNFLTTDPGGNRETLNLGATTGSGGLFGQAAGLDWRNNRKNEVANIYAHNMGGVFSSSTYTRAQAFVRFGHSVAGTASHELGHNLGLQHYDCYCHPSIGAPTYGGINGLQNTAIMATGSTGLTLAGRGVGRSFSQGERLKLEFAHGVTGNLGVTVTETAGAHNTFGNAQTVIGTQMPLSGLLAVNIDGRTTVSGESDMYRFTANAGAKIIANTFSAAGIMADSTNTALTLFDKDFNQLMFNDNITFSGNSFLQGSGGYSTDSLIQNFTAAYTGNYYLRVIGTGSGDYDLLIAGLNPVPEPATVLALAAGSLALLRRRTRRSKS
jgi:hypothetical protein